MGSADFSLRLVGAQHPNEDGSSRQEELGRCREGERTDLVREPHNPHDPSAVAVLSARGVKIGYLGANYCGWVGSKIDRGYDVRAIIGRIGRFGQAGFRGAVITINMDGEDPEIPPDFD